MVYNGEDRILRSDCYGKIESKETAYKTGT
jgi:hypothetical protein